MFAYIVRRLLYAPLILIGVNLLLFRQRRGVTP